MSSKQKLLLCTVARLAYLRRVRQRSLPPRPQRHPWTHATTTCHFTVRRHYRIGLRIQIYNLGANPTMSGFKDWRILQPFIQKIKLGRRISHVLLHLKLAFPAIRAVMPTSIMSLAVMKAAHCIPRVISIATVCRVSEWLISMGIVAYGTIATGSSG